MTAYRAGQRVRIQGQIWAVEGVLFTGPKGRLFVDMPGDDYEWPVEEWATSRGVTVTVLSEPRPDEPTGLGAVVDDRLGTVWVRVDHHGSGFACWREVTPGRYDSDACMREWKHVDAVRVLSEGWDQ